MRERPPWQWIVPVSVAGALATTLLMGALAPTDRATDPQRTIYQARGSVSAPGPELVAFGHTSAGWLSTRIECHLVARADEADYLAIAQVGAHHVGAFEPERFDELCLPPEMLPEQPDDAPVRTTSVQEVATGFPLRAFMARRVLCRTLDTDDSRTLINQRELLTHGSARADGRLVPTSIRWHAAGINALCWALVWSGPLVLWRRLRGRSSILAS
jgi:hypothetical protein